MSEAKFKEMDISPTFDDNDDVSDSSGWVRTDIGSMEEMPIPKVNSNLKKKVNESVEPARNRGFDVVNIPVSDEQLKFTPETRRNRVKLKVVLPFIKYLILAFVLWFSLQVIMLDVYVNLACVFISLFITFLIICLNYRDNRKEGIFFDIIRMIGEAQYSMYVSIGRALKPIFSVLICAILILALIAIVVYVLTRGRGI